MKHDIFVAVYLLVMGGFIVSADALFLRDHFWARLGTHVGVVAVFAPVSLLFLRNAFK